MKWTAYVLSRHTEDQPIPWFTAQHAEEAAERMKAYASTAPGLHVSLSEKSWLNLARVALELRAHD